MKTENPDSTRAAPSQQVSGFDAERLRAKYREERDKRIRADANDQYLEVKARHLLHW